MEAVSHNSGDSGKKTLISIIIPTYNSEDHIECLLVNIMNQNFKDFEVLIIDNVSTDRTLDIIRKNHPGNEQINIFSSKDSGIYDAMNKGIACSKGEWMYFMGADDRFYNNDALALIAKHLTIENDIVYGNVMWVPQNAVEEGEWTYDVFIHRNINHQRIFYRKTLFEIYGGYNIKYQIASDHELNIRLFCNKAIKKKFIPEIIAKYYSEGFSSRKTDEPFWEDWDNIIYTNFKPYLTKKAIYSNLGVYCRYNIAKKKYRKALGLISKVFINTFNFGFVKLMGSHLLKKLNAS